MHIIILLILSLALCGCLGNQPAPKPLSLSPIGVTVEGMPVGGLPSEELLAALSELAKRQSTFPQNAIFDAEGKIITEKNGRVLDIQGTADAVMAAPPHSQAIPVYQQIGPPITREKLAAARRIGGYETPILDKDPDRVKNIVLTASLVNNTIIDQGQEFSFNALTGEPTLERLLRRVQ
jgi:vancomycin resistance protein YoaR